MKKYGLIMPMFSLPSPYGIGTMGKAAFDFVDSLKAGGYSVWQMLPLGHTGYGDSPYQPMSSFAGNPYFIDLDLLVAEGLLFSQELPAPTPVSRVDYGDLFRHRLPLLFLAAKRGIARKEKSFLQFCKDKNLQGYAAFMALKDKNGGTPWNAWQSRKYDKNRKKQYLYLQYLFFKQFSALRTYAHKNGIKLMGDLPFYVGYDSADVWQNQDQFLLDTDLLPLWKAGVPPDYFSADGQLWGNPIYNWEKMRKNHYAFWQQRYLATAKLFDYIRLDHFRAMEAFWAVPKNALTAKDGHWEKGEGKKLLDLLKKSAPRTTLIAEDLGLITPAVKALLKSCRLSGMKVLQFAFDGNPENPYLPKNHIYRSVCYTGTHDNEPLPDFCRNTGRSRSELLQMAQNSKSFLTVTQWQDWGEELNLRTNTPSTNQGNWTVRATEGQIILATRRAL